MKVEEKIVSSVGERAQSLSCYTIALSEASMSYMLLFNTCRCKTDVDVSNPRDGAKKRDLKVRLQVRTRGNQGTSISLFFLSVIPIRFYLEKLHTC